MGISQGFLNMANNLQVRDYALPNGERVSHLAVGHDRSQDTVQIIRRDGERVLLERTERQGDTQYYRTESGTVIGVNMVDGNLTRHTADNPNPVRLEPANNKAEPILPTAQALSRDF